MKLGVFLCNSLMTSICGMLLYSPLWVSSFPSPPPHICLFPVIPCCFPLYRLTKLFVYYFWFPLPSCSAVFVRIEALSPADCLQVCYKQQFVVFLRSSASTFWVPFVVALRVFLMNKTTVRFGLNCAFL